MLHLRVTSGFSAQTWQFGFLSFGLQQTNNFFEAAFRRILISLQSSILPFKIFTACSVTRPAQTAFVVAMAKMGIFNLCVRTINYGSYIREPK